MATFYLGCCLELIADEDFMFDDYPKEDSQKIIKLCNIVFGISEEFVKPSPQQVLFIKGSQNGANIHQVNFLAGYYFLFVVE